jgi:hypothetical protein
MNFNEEEQFLSPRAVIEQVANAIPMDCRANIIIIGSLAAAYHFFGNDPDQKMRTKDIDCLLSPRIRAIPAGKAVTERLFSERWTYRVSEEWPGPGDANTADEKLPVVRMNPPGSHEWFVELLTVPESSVDQAAQSSRLETTDGHFLLPSFPFLSIPEYKPISTEYGVLIARPEMMALANLLEHPVIGSRTMSTKIGGRIHKRSNKDLGRVLAIARLSGEAMIENWPALWKEVLQNKFENEWQSLTRKAGGGLRQLLDPVNEPDFREAHYICAQGLLVRNPPTLDELRATGERLLVDVIDPLESLPQ